MPVVFIVVPFTCSTMPHVQMSLLISLIIMCVLLSPILPTYLPSYILSSIHVSVHTCSLELLTFWIQKLDIQETIVLISLKEIQNGWKVFCPWCCHQGSCWSGIHYFIYSIYDSVVHLIKINKFPSCRKMCPLKKFLKTWNVQGMVWAQMKLKSDWNYLDTINLKRKRLEVLFCLHLLCSIYCFRGFHSLNLSFLLQESKILKFLSFMWNPLSWVMEAAAIMAIALAHGGVSLFIYNVLWQFIMRSLIYSSLILEMIPLFCREKIRIIMISLAYWSYFW